MSIAIEYRLPVRSSTRSGPSELPRGRIVGGQHCIRGSSSRVWPAHVIDLPSPCAEPPECATRTSRNNFNRSFEQHLRLDLVATNSENTFFDSLTRCPDTYGQSRKHEPNDGRHFAIVAQLGMSPLLSKEESQMKKRLIVPFSAGQARAALAQLLVSHLIRVESSV
jgi:hypothetical protein